jgi:sulfatase modifying factor 1
MNRDVQPSGRWAWGARAALAMAMGAVGIGAGCGTAVRAGAGTPPDASTEGFPAREGGLDSAVADDAGPTPPSCAASGAGVSDCGANNEGCCTSTIVMGGTYYRTYDGVTQFGSQATLASDGGATGVADPATVSDFRLDRYLATVGRFRAFVSAWSGGSGWLPPPGSGKHSHLNGGLGIVNAAVDGGIAYEPGWVASDDTNIVPTNANLACDPYSDSGTWTPAAGNSERRPINCVNWYEAYAFCIWDGGFLPSEAEWGNAAAGGAQQREYPWGSTYPGMGNQYAIYNCLYPNGPDGSDACLGGVTNIAPVGTAALGAGRWGQLDLAGEVLEWNLDLFSLRYVNPCTDCAYLTPSPSTNDHVDRGGYFGFPVHALYSATRQIFSQLSSARSALFGFRCARTP